MKVFRLQPDCFDHLKTLGIEPTDLWRRSGLPAASAAHERSLNTAQLFSVWRAMAAMGAGAASAFKLAALALDRNPALQLLLTRSRTLADLLARTERYQAACTPQRLKVEAAGRERVVALQWPLAHEQAPNLLVDAELALLLELGRRGVGHGFAPARVELRRRADPGAPHAAHFLCPVKFRAERDAIVLAEDHLQLAVAARAGGAQGLHGGGHALERSGTAAAVRRALEHLIIGCRPDLAAVADELSLSVRTLQRHISAERTSFRELLLHTRQGLAADLLGQPQLGLEEVAFLLGFEDSTSFFRAFRRWHGVTPGDWRARRPCRRQVGGEQQP
jgi:AraC-like DNA-binding protein